MKQNKHALADRLPWRPGKFIRYAGEPERIYYFDSPEYIAAFNANGLIQRLLEKARRDRP